VTSGTMSTAPKTTLKATTRTMEDLEKMEPRPCKKRFFSSFEEEMGLPPKLSPTISSLRSDGHSRSDCCAGGEKPTIGTLCAFLLGAYLSPPLLV